MDSAQFLARLAGLAAIAILLLALQMGEVEMPGGKVGGYSSALIGTTSATSPFRGES